MIGGTGSGDELLRGFLAESWGVLAGIEDAVAGLEGESADKAAEVLALLTHRLKGSAALYGLDGTARVAGAMAGAARAASVAGDGERAIASSFLAEAVATLSGVLENVQASGTERITSIRDLGERFPQFFVEADDRAEAEVAAVEGLDPDAVDALRHFGASNPETLEYFVPEVLEHLDGIDESLDGEGGGKDRVASLFRLVHTLKGAAFTVGCVPMGERAHELEDLLVELRDRGESLTDASRKVLREGARDLRRMLEVARRPALAEERPDTGGPEDLPEDLRAVHAAVFGAATSGGRAASSAAPAERPTIRVELADIDRLLNLTGEAVISRGRLDLSLESFSRVGALLEASRDRMRDTVRDFESKYLNPALEAGREGRASGSGLEPIALSGIFDELELDRYDDFNVLARRVGEVSADLGEVSQQFSEVMSQLRTEATQLQRLVRQLRSGIGGARMVPIGQLFRRLSRAARQAAENEGKQINVVIAGEGAEIDTLIVERIVDPVMHLVRNAVTHGVEHPVDRVAAGKNETAQISLAAYPAGQFLRIEISDDGIGMDPRALAERAVKIGLISREAADALEDKEALGLIFLRGFSTSDTVTQVAGRGVGMDVVRTNLAKISGEVEIETEKGSGTLFSLKLPLTLAVSEALLIGMAEEVYALPITAVKALTTLVESDIEKGERGEFAQFEGERLELVRLRQVVGTPRPAPTDRTQVAVVRTGTHLVLLAVDELLGIEEVVIKGLGGFLSGLSIFSGATLSADGRLALLLDPSGLSAAVRAGVALPVRPEFEAQESAPAASVLLADDSISVRRVLGSQLEEAGFEVTLARDGEEALELLRTGQLFDALVTDLEMPRLNGFELIDEVRRREDCADLPILVITTRVGAKHLELARDLGVTECFGKPVETEAVVAKLTELTLPRLAREA